jgi:ribosomal protein S17E
MLLERFPEKFSIDYVENMKTLAQVAFIPSKKIRHKIAGYITKLKRKENKN